MFYSEIGSFIRKILLLKRNLISRVKAFLWEAYIDYFLPTSACLIQKRLGLRTNIGAVDFNLGCSGYVYGLAIAKGLVIGGLAKNVLLLTA